jgi:hypothetical protein
MRRRGRDTTDLRAVMGLRAVITAGRPATTHRDRATMVLRQAIEPIAFLTSRDLTKRLAVLPGPGLALEGSLDSLRVQHPRR